jgi:hypothetical protein
MNPNPAEIGNDVLEYCGQDTENSAKRGTGNEAVEHVPQ